MSRFALLCVVLLLASNAYATDICKTTSVSQRLVDSLTDFTPYNGLTTVAGISSAFQALQQATTTAAAGSTLGVQWGGVVIGFGSGSLIGYVGSNPSNNGGNPLLFVAVNQAVFGDLQAHFFASTNASNQYSQSVYSFATLQWFTKATSSLWGADNWSNNPLVDDTTLSTLANTYSYAYRKAFTAPAAGVVAGFRFAREVCGTCYVNTFPQTIVVQQAAASVPTSLTVSDTSGFQQFINFLLPYVVNNTNSAVSFTNAGYINFIVGFENDISFMIKDCQFMSGGGSAQCSHPGTVRYQLWVSCPPVFGNNTRFVYQINADGSMGGFVGLGNSPAAPSGAYDVNTRGFFTATSGWTNVNSVADATLTLNRRFVIANGQGHYPGGTTDSIVGVVGGEFIDNGEGVCGSGASSIVLSVMGMIVMIAIALIQ